uniref:F-box domain-containing protein n=1 Tax=Mycena chlorophos TaxID=658473 RepID=A0ABQ0LUW6_MYCCL|nr:predicted protein [Mycena chlorophos]
MGMKCATIFDLPTELIADIFLAYLPPYPAYPNLRKKAETPVSLGHICRQWRQIAWATPSLWRAVGLDMWQFNKSASKAYDPEPDDPGCLVFLQEFLDRSGSCALWIQIFGDANDPRIFDAIWPYRERWEYLALDVNTVGSISSAEQYLGY